MHTGTTRTSSPPKTITNAPLQLFDLQDSWNKGMTERPDLLQARLNVEQQGIQLKFYHNQLFPELDLIGTYGYNGSGEQFQRHVQPVRRRQPAILQLWRATFHPVEQCRPAQQYKADKVTLQQLLLQLKQFEQNVMVDIDNAVKTGAVRL